MQLLPNQTPVFVIWIDSFQLLIGGIKEIDFKTEKKVVNNDFRMSTGAAVDVPAQC